MLIADVLRSRAAADESAERADLDRIFLVPLLVVVLLTKFEGRLILGVPQGARRRGDLRPRLADRLARRLPGAAPQAGHDARAVDGSARRQAADHGGARLAGADGSRAGVDGGGHPRPRIRGDVLRSIAYARGVAIPASPLGKIKMVSQVVAILLLILGARSPAASSSCWAHRAVGRGRDGGRLGRRLLPPLQPRAQRPRT